MIEIYKMLTGKYDKDSCIEFKFVTYPGTHTRGNKLKYTKIKFIIISENSSSQTELLISGIVSVIEANSVNSFNKKAQLMLSNPCDVKACKNCSNLTCFVSFHRILFPQISNYQKCIAARSCLYIFWHSVAG